MDPQYEPEINPLGLSPDFGPRLKSEGDLSTGEQGIFRGGENVALVLTMQKWI